MKVDQLQTGKGEFSILNSRFSIRGASRAGFTLIEMLVVIVIIAILMGIVFKLSRGVMSRNESAKEVGRVALLKAMIEEFHAEYGVYPPVPKYDGVQPVSFVGPFPKDKNDFVYYAKNYAPSREHPFQFGLLSFFVDRGEFGEQTFRPEVLGTHLGDSASDEEKKAFADWNWFNDEVNLSEKDKAFVKRVKPILDKLKGNDSYFGTGSEFDENGHTKGFYARVKDSWWHSYVYISEPPYTSYLIFSMGPDGKYDKSNPGDRTLADNKDNIYGDLEDK